MREFNLEKDMTAFTIKREKMTSSNSDELRTFFTKFAKELQKELGLTHAMYANGGSLDYEDLQTRGGINSLLSNPLSSLSTFLNSISQMVWSKVVETARFVGEWMVELLNRVLDKKPTPINSKMYFSPQTAVDSTDYPQSGVPLTNILSKNSQDLLYGFRRTITQSVLNGDTFNELWQQTYNILNKHFKKYNSILRIESHRVQEDIKQRVKDLLLKVLSPFDIVEETWRNQGDANVRQTVEADHVVMEGQVKKMGYFNLDHRVLTTAPGLSGDPANDCNCRCFVTYVLKLN